MNFDFDKLQPETLSKFRRVEKYLADNPDVTIKYACARSGLSTNWFRKIRDELLLRGGLLAAEQPRAEILNVGERKAREPRNRVNVNEFPVDGFGWSNWDSGAATY